MKRQPSTPETRRRPRKLLRADRVRRRLLKLMRSIDAMIEELDDLQQQLKVPSLAQYDRIDSGHRISMDALLLGVIYAAGFNLGEASLVIRDHAARYTRRTLTTARRVSVGFEVLRGLGRLVRRHAGEDEFNDIGGARRRQ